MSKTHHYIYNDKRYGNMKDCRESIGNGKASRRQFRAMMALGVVQKFETEGYKATNIIAKNNNNETTKIKS